MKLVNVYAYASHENNGQYQILQLPKVRNANGSPDWSKGSKPMIFPSIWIEKEVNGSFVKKGRQLSPPFFLAGYVSDELKGRTQEQHDASEAFDKTHGSHPAMPIFTTHHLFKEKLMVVTIDLDTLSGVTSNPTEARPIPFALEKATPYIPAQNERWENKDWVVEQTALWIVSNPKAIEEYNAALANTKVKAEAGVEVKVKQESSQVETSALQATALQNIHQAYEDSPSTVKDGSNLSDATVIISIAVKTEPMVKTEPEQPSSTTKSNKV